MDLAHTANDKNLFELYLEIYVHANYERSSLK